MAISDRIAVMENGRIAQLDTAEMLYRRPASAFVAGFLGRANLLRVTVEHVENGRAILDLGGQKLVARLDSTIGVGSAASVIVRPESISMGPPNGGLTGVVRTRTYLGEKIEYEVTLAGQTLHVVRFDPAEDEGFAPGSPVSLIVPEAKLRLLGGEGSQLDTAGPGP